MWPVGQVCTARCNGGSCSGCRQAGRQLVGCLNERSNEHRNECAPHDKYVKFLLKLSSICCQFLTTSATNFVLVLVLVLGVSQTQLNSTSFSYFFSASFLAQQQFFPGTCSSSSSRSTHRSFSALSSWLLATPCWRPSPPLAHFKLLTQKLILASGCCQPEPEAAARAAPCQLLLLPVAALTLCLPLPLSPSTLSRCAFSGFSFFC